MMTRQQTKEALASRLRVHVRMCPELTILEAIELLKTWAETWQGVQWPHPDTMRAIDDVLRDHILTR